MGLENIMNGLGLFKRKLASAALVGSLLTGCSGSQGNQSPTAPHNPLPPPPPAQPQNHAPVINSAPIISIGENSFYEYRVQATDPDGDPVSYSVEGTPWLSVSHNTVYGNSPEVLQDTNFPVKIKVSDGKSSTEQNYNLIVNNVPKAYPLSADHINKLLQVTPSNMVFSQPMDFAVNDVIGSGISSKTPNGILREIISISPDRKTIYTSQATLEQIVKKASFSFAKNLSPSNIQSSLIKSGVSNSENLEGLAFGVSLQNVVLYDRDGNQNTKSDQVIANGKISFNTGFSFDVDIDNFNLKYLKFQNTTDEIADITISSNLTGIASSKEIKLTEYVFNPLVIGYIPTVIPIPIVVTPKIGVYVNINPTQINPLGLRVLNGANLNTSLIYNNGSWSKNSDFFHDISFSPFNPTGNWDLQVSAGPKLELLLYDIAGPIAGVNSKLKLESQSGDWKLYGGFEAYMGVTMDLFSKKVAAHFEKVFDYEKVLAENASPTLPVRTDTLRAEKDAYVRLNVFPDGTKTYAGFNTSSLDVIKNYFNLPAGSETETLIQFPLASIPSNSNVTSAKLVLYGDGLYNIVGGTADIQARRISGAWTESTVKWNTKPLYAETVSSSTVYAHTAKNYEWDVTSLVQSWTKGQLLNNGIALLTNDNPDGPSRFNSREHQDSSKRPMLIISYR